LTEFADRWQTNRDKDNVPKKLKDAMNPPGDLRKKLVDTDRSLTAQISKLDKTVTKMAEKEKVLFNKTTIAFQKHDTTELSEHRKAMKLVQSSRLCLEQVQMRLKTITDFGDLANVIAPVGQVVRTVRSSLQKVMPSANDTLSEISTGLQGMMTDIGSVPGMSMNFESNGEEAERILAEASVIAETKMASSLPDIPNTELNTTDSNATI
jgi:division protein CdvB (Snf7/Vps24/ESCRT-III family)